MTRDELPDSVLIARAKRGEWEAFEQLFWRYHEQIYTFVWHFFQNREVSEDLTQETFVRAWEALHNLKSNDSFRAWLHQIARRLCLDTLRKRTRETPMSDTANQDEPPISISEVETDLRFILEGENSPNEIAPEEVLLENERKKAIHAAVGKLSETLREVVVLHYFEGLPVDEIARVLGVPVGTVLSRLARARNNLRQLLAHFLDEVAKEVNSP